MAALTALILGIGKLAGGNSGMIMALIFAIPMNFVSYWWGDKIVLAMTHAQPVSESEAPDLHRMVERLAS